MLKQDVPEVSGKKVLVMFLKCISYPYRKFPSFTEKGTWYCLKSSGLRVATTTVQLLWPMWLESIIRIFSGLEMKKDYFIIFFCFHSQYYINSFHPSLYISISTNNEQKQCFRTVNTPAESKHVCKTGVNPQD